MNIDFRSPNPRPSKTAKTGAASVTMVSARQRRVTPSASAWWRLTRMRSVAQFTRYARFFMIDGLTPTRADFQAKQSGRGGPACLTYPHHARFESPLFQAQGDLRLLLTFTYHGCPRICREDDPAEGFGEGAGGVY